MGAMRDPNRSSEPKYRRKSGGDRRIRRAGIGQGGRRERWDSRRGSLRQLHPTGAQRQSQWPALQTGAEGRMNVTSSATLAPHHDTLRPDRLGMRLLSLQLLMKVLPAQRGDEKRQADGNRDKHGRRHIRVMHPSHFMEALKNISR